MAQGTEHGRFGKTLINPQKLDICQKINPGRWTQKDTQPRRRRCRQGWDRGQPPCHLQGVVESRAGWMQCEVLEGLDTGLPPAMVPGPLHHQHVVGESLAKHQGLTGAWLLLRLLCHLQLQICSLRKDKVFRCLGIWLRSLDWENYNSHEPLGFRPTEKDQLPRGLWKMQFHCFPTA
jgi:hypothetical protein